MNNDQANVALVESAQISALFSRARFVYSINVINAMVVGAFLWGTISTGTLLTWMVAVIGITAVRFLLLVKYDQDKSKNENLGYWKKVAVWGATLSGIIWGLSWILLFPPSAIPQQIFLLVLILGMMAGSSVSWHAYFPSFVAFFLPTLFLTSIGFILAILPGSEVRAMFAAMGVLFLVFSAGLFALARNSSQILSSLIIAQNEKVVSEERYRALFRGAKVPMLLIDPMNGGIVDINAAAEDYYGYPHGQLSQMNIDQINTLTRQEIAEEMLRAERNNKFIFNFRHRLASGEIRDVEVHSGAITMTNQHLLYSIVQDITDRRRAEYSLKMESEKNLALLRNASDGIHIINRTGNIIESSESFCSMLGYRREEMIGMHILQWDAKFTDEEMSEMLKQLYAKQERFQFETCHRRKDGTTLDVEISSVSLELGGQPVLFNSSRDITQRKQTEHNLRIAATAFESQEGILITDTNNEILRVNQAVTAITGYAAAELIGKNPKVLGSGRQDAKFYATMWDSINRTGIWEGEIWNRRKSGEIYPEHISITVVKDINGIVTNYVASFIDITLRKEAEERIQHLAFYDSLTELPNRRLLLDRLQQALASIERSEKQGALLFIDLDNFKILNDTLGHDIGDLLLQQVAQRLVSCVREGDTVARLGGDEFVVMLEDLSGKDREAAEQTGVVAEKILALLNQPYMIASHLYHSSTSIGATLFNHTLDSIDELLKQADIAMYQAKKEGRNTLRFFDPQMQIGINARMALERELRGAIENNEFILYYQIQVDGSDPQRSFGAEALIRWVHPERGLVSPAEFIPLAEDTGLILPIGEWVLETACLQLVKWSAQPETSRLTVAVNVSAHQFHQIDFAENVLAVIERTGAPPQRLKLELTESMLLNDIESVITKMRTLKTRGVGFSLDDFGTGYSSLSYLSRLPLDQIKIDRSFVTGLGSDENSAVICSSIISLAHSLNLKVVAEGIETEAQSCILTMGHQCDCLQGYLYGKPLQIEQFELLQRGISSIPD